MKESEELYLLRYRYGRTAEMLVAYRTFLNRQVQTGQGKYCQTEDVVKNITHTLLVTFYSFIHSLFDKSGTNFISTTEPYLPILTEDGKKFRKELLDIWEENKTAISKLRNNVGFHGGLKLKNQAAGYSSFSEIHPQVPDLIMNYFSLFFIELDKVVTPSEVKSGADAEKMKRFLVDRGEFLKEKIGDPYWQTFKKIMEEFEKFD